MRARRVSASPNAGISDSKWDHVPLGSGKLGGENRMRTGPKSAWGYCVGRGERGNKLRDAKNVIGEEYNGCNPKSSDTYERSRRGPSVELVIEVWSGLPGMGDLMRNKMAGGHTLWHLTWQNDGTDGNGCL